MKYPRTLTRKAWTDDNHPYDREWERWYSIEETVTLKVLPHDLFHLLISNECADFRNPNEPGELQIDLHCVSYLFFVRKNPGENTYMIEAIYDSPN